MSPLSRLPNGQVSSPNGIQAFIGGCTDDLLTITKRRLPRHLQAYRRSDLFGGVVTQASHGSPLGSKVRILKLDHYRCCWEGMRLLLQPDQVTTRSSRQACP